MPDRTDALVDGYLTDRLAADEQRELAQAALDDPELFDLLTAAAITKTVLTTSPVTVSSRVAVSTGTWTWVGLATAAAVAAVVVAIQRVPVGDTTTPSATQSPPSAVPENRGPVDAEPAPARPALLVARLDMPDGRGVEFRGVEEESRLPKSQGIVIAVEQGNVTIDLGSIDGLQQGTVVRIVPGAPAAPVGGTATVTRVFRERAVAAVAGVEQPRGGDRVVVPAATQVSALVDRVSARLASGDLAGARSLAERAVSLAEDADVSADVARRAHAQLGRIEYRSEALAPAERHLRLAAEALDRAPRATPAERGGLLNELGVVLIEQGRYTEAEEVLRRAQMDATGEAGVYVANNLGALSVLRGDRTTADTMYREAQALADIAGLGDTDRRAIARNLDAIRSPQ